MRLMITQESTKSVPSNGMTKGFSQGYLVGSGQVRHGRIAKESPDQVTQTLAPHAYACPPRVEGQQRRAQTKLHRLWLPTHMRAIQQPQPACFILAYAYAYHLIHHPANHLSTLRPHSPRICVPSTHMRATITPNTIIPHPA
ncbi:hypothetical protein PIB30_092723 [Stylosanthes scabra]|uniref:Uncharacterized protein n=1 Tax=Stylosanthes scabra TaxID=79078 RepID=A0ABU6QWA9_9FABA|nr:hypothetical protein [Stylosanthes scabra]